MFFQVKELEVGFIQLLETTGDCMHFSAAIESIGNGYEPKEQVNAIFQL